MALCSFDSTLGTFDSDELTFDIVCAEVVPPAPEVPPALPPVYGTGPYRVAVKQRARAIGIAANDEFGALGARYIPPAPRAARVAVLREAEAFSPIRWRGLNRAAAASPAQNDEFPRVAARRGLPPRALVEWFLKNVA